MRPAPPVIALVGDFSPDVPAHRAIPWALRSANEADGTRVAWRWFATRDIDGTASALAACAAVWVMPGSPYENMPGALAAIRRAREGRRPLLGTCGGFQHVLIEFARQCAGLPEADHAESNPAGARLVVTRLACPLVEQAGEVRLAPGSRLRAIYGADAAREMYHCRFGPDPACLDALAQAGLQFAAHDETGAVRAAELPAAAHPFFVATLYQPERAALGGGLHPLVRAFARAAAQAAPFSDSL